MLVIISSLVRRSAWDLKGMQQDSVVSVPRVSSLIQAQTAIFLALFRLAHATRDWIHNLEEVEAAPQRYLDTLELPEFPSPWTIENALL